MHIQEVGTGRAIYPGGAPPAPPPKSFSAKEEPVGSALADSLCKLNVPGLRVISASGEKILYSRDQSEIPRFLKGIMFRSVPDLVAQPTTAEGVAAVLKFARAKGVTAIPRGSGSSPFGGSVPVAGGIVVDMSKMDRILEIDVGERTVTVQAGARWADIDQEIERWGLALNTTPSSKFSTVGGWLATGGMGLNSFSRGHVSASVLSVDIVTPDGSTRTLNQGDPGFQEVFGSEGQLGVLVSAKISLRKKEDRSRPHLLFFDDTESALKFAGALARSEVHPAHIVYESPAKFSYINILLKKDYFRAADAIIVNIEGEGSEKAFDSFLKTAQSKEEKEFLARYMWNERYFPMKVRKFGPGLLGSEVVVERDRLSGAVTEANDLCKMFGLEPLFEVHFLDDGTGLLLCYFMTDQGNTVKYTMDAFKSMLVTSKLLDLGAKPYSIGVWNFPFSDAEDRARFESLRKAKSAMDPKGVMNSGKYFTLSGRLGGVAGLAFRPKLMRPVLKVMVLLSPMTSRLMGYAYRFADKRLKPKGRTDLLRTADECAMCGACVSVCPAYMVVRDERVTARGKLLTAKAMAKGAKISKEHAQRTFLCMRCKACEQVCQSKLDLMTAYDVLEGELEALCGKDAAEIEKFIRYTENTPEYDELVKRGLVLGAPKHGMGGEQADV
jgi:FAD/FMN-containing dehydrogenase/ferredoxin